MTAPKPASLNFDSLPTTPNNDFSTHGTSYGTLVFARVGAGGAYSTSQISTGETTAQDHYLSISLTYAPSNSGVRISAQDGSNFGIKSMKLILTQNPMADLTVKGFDAENREIVSDTLNTGATDLFGAVHYSADDGTLTFGPAWKDVSAISLIKPAEGHFYFGLDDIVLQTSSLQFAADSDSGTKGDAITNLHAPVLEGSAEASSELDVFIDGATEAFTTVITNADGEYTLDKLTFEDDGEHTVTVRMKGSTEAGATFTFTLDTKAEAPAGLGLDSTYAVGDPLDAITSDMTPQITGTAEKGATVTLYDGERKVGEAVANAQGKWEITTDELDDGDYSLTAKQVDVAGNESPASAPIDFTVKSGRPSTPKLSADSDSGVKGDGITNDSRPMFTGTAAAQATVKLVDSTGKLLGIGEANEDGNWSIAVGDGMPYSLEQDRVKLLDGKHKIHAEVVVQDSASTQPLVLESGIVKVEIDTIRPDAPHAPALTEASDSGTLGDNITNIAAPTLSGHGADKYALIEVYADGKLVGSTKANDEGTWSIKTTTLAAGKQALTAVQYDAAGNASPTSEALELTIEQAPVVRPPMPSPRPNTVDGVQVTTKPVLLPGGTAGNAVEVPIVSTSRKDTDGNGLTADIPLASSNGQPLLTAQIGAGFGLNASGGAVSGANAVFKELIGMIEAVGKSNAKSDIGKLMLGGDVYLKNLATAEQLLVETVTFKGASVSGSAIDLVGSGGGQQVALVLDGAQLPAGSNINLSNIEFAAVLGALNVSGGATSMILSGDDAAQGFTVGSNASKVFAGGGADLLKVDFGIAASAAARAASVSTTAAVAGDEAMTTMLHGGTGLDTATFDGTAADYTIEEHGGYVLVSSKAAPDQVAKLVNVEALRFGDGVVQLEAGTGLAALAGLYQDVLGRQADADGFSFWAGRAEAGMSLGSIAVELLGSSEGAARLGALDGNAEHDIGLLYRAVFDRAADAGGLAFWAGNMDNGMSLVEVADHLMHSVEIVGRQLDVAEWDFTV